MKERRIRRGRSYEKRVADVNRIYDLYSRSGLPNREIWKRYIYPLYGICERQFYNLLKAPMEPRKSLEQEGFLFPEMHKEDEQRREGYYRKDPD